MLIVISCLHFFQIEYKVVVQFAYPSFAFAESEYAFEAWVSNQHAFLWSICYSCSSICACIFIFCIIPFTLVALKQYVSHYHGCRAPFLYCKLWPKVFWFRVDYYCAARRRKVFLVRVRSRLCRRGTLITDFSRSAYHCRYYVISTRMWENARLWKKLPFFCCSPWWVEIHLDGLVI